MTYIKSLRGQQWLLPPSIEDLIPKDHVCLLVESLMDSLDYTQFDIKYAGAGHPAYHPRISLKLLVMGVLDRVRSSRCIARNARENIVYMYLAEKVAPDFRTISDFRKNNPTLVREVFKHTVALAKQSGMLDLSHLSTDGSTVKANAANKNTLTAKELEFLLKFVDNELDMWAKQDASEDRLFGELRGCDQLPNQSKRKIQQTVKKYLEGLKTKGDTFKEEVKVELNRSMRELTEHRLKRVSTTDPECRFMKNKKGRLELSYNIQLTVDKRGIILANDVCQDQFDTYQMQPQICQTEENLQMLPENIPWSFDTGYFDGENLRLLHDKKIDGHIPPCKSKTDNPYDKKHFRHDLVKDEYLCPANQTLKFLKQTWEATRNKQKRKIVRIYRGQTCAVCEHRSRCTKTKDGIRQIKSNAHEIERTAMGEKMQTHQAKETYKLRARTVEPVIGDIKENKGVRTFLTRNLRTVKTELNLVCAATNLRRIWTGIQDRGASLRVPAY